MAAASSRPSSCERTWCQSTDSSRAWCEETAFGPYRLVRSANALADRPATESEPSLASTCSTSSDADVPISPAGPY
jgi:hypothetical protein